MTQIFDGVFCNSVAASSSEIRGKFGLEKPEISSYLEILQDLFDASHCLWVKLPITQPVNVPTVSKFVNPPENLLNLTLQLYQEHLAHLGKGHLIALSNDSPSVLLCPLIYPDYDPTILAIYHHDKPYIWSEQDIKIVRKIALQALTVNQEKLHQKLSKILNSSLSFNELFKEMLGLIAKYYDLEQILILQTNKNQINLIHKWQQDLDEDWIKQYLGIDLLKNIPQQFCSYPTQQYSNILTLPIKVKGDNFGFLVLITSDNQREFSEIEKESLEPIIDQIALGIYHEQNQEFLDETIHELRNPLVGILGFARVLQEQIYGNLNEKQLQYVGLIANAGEYLRDLINDFLDLSRVDADKEELYVEKFAVKDLCLASLALVRERALEQGLELKLEIGKNVDFFLADQRRLKQILVNLLSNAVKFTEIGSVTLKVEQTKQQITFAVVDTGIGIAPEDHKKLFRPFGQIKKHPLERKQKGSGLGLALSRKLAQLHGGDIVLTSTPGKGTCLTVIIPVQPVRG